MAFYETGEMRRRCGDLAAAEDAFRSAHELGMDPQPGLALLRHAQGKPDPALTTLRLAIDGDHVGGLRRARLLAALIDVALDAGRTGDGRGPRWRSWRSFRPRSTRRRSAR